MNDKLWLPDEDQCMEDFLAYNVGWCGCGDNEKAGEFLKAILKLCPFYEEEHTKALHALLPHEGLFWFVLYQIDYHGLIEHGGNVSGSWLTEKGKAVLEYLEREDLEDK